MNRYIPATVLAAFALALAACGGGSSGYGGSTPSGGSTPTAPPSAAADTVILGIPTGAIGVENDPTWGTVSGYSQSTYSQVLAFAPGTTITIENASTTTSHTLNVLSTSSGPPASFPSNPSLSTSASGGSSLGTGYASGSIAAGSSVSVTLSNPGTYLIGCAYHYSLYGMRDVIQVSANATPGPQATAQPSSGGGYGGGNGY